MSALTDITSLTTTLTTYWTNLGTYLQNPTTAFPVTNYPALLSSVTYGDLVTQLQQSFDSSTDPSYGALANRQDTYSAHARDLALRTQSKSQYYTEAVAEFSNQISLENADSTLSSNLAQGLTPYQSQTLT